MSNNERPLIIGSGTTHSVSVSEHTGNAKSPRNRIRADVEASEDEIFAKDKEESAGRASIFADASNVGQKKGGFFSKLSQGENILNPDMGLDAQNNQHLESDSFKKSSAHGFENNDARETPHGIFNTPVADKQDKVISHGLNVENVQAIDLGNNLDNIQAIGLEKEEANLQKISPDIDSGNFQKLSKEKDSVNIQALPSEIKASADAPVISNLTHKNSASLEGVTDGFRPHLPLETGGADNHQAIKNKKNADNKQLIDTPHSEPYPQPAIARNIPDGNKHSIEKEHIEDHLEKLPSQNQDGPASNINSANTHNNLSLIESTQKHLEALQIKEKSAELQVFKNDGKLAEIKGKLKAANSQMEIVHAQLDALETVQNESPMKSLRERQHEAFIGRVARMKLDVAAVNSQLDQIERKR